jgi:hypothetical protein
MKIGGLFLDSLQECSEGVLAFGLGVSHPGEHIVEGLKPLGIHSFDPCGMVRRDGDHIEWVFLALLFGQGHMADVAAIHAGIEVVFAGEELPHINGSLHYCAGWAGGNPPAHSVLDKELISEFDRMYVNLHESILAEWE